MQEGIRDARKIVQIQYIHSIRKEHFLEQHGLHLFARPLVA
jgi:hypothetical protein